MNISKNPNGRAWIRHIRLCWYRIKAWVVITFGRKQPFSHEQFLDDCKITSDIVAHAARNLLAKNTFMLRLNDESEPRAKAQKMHSPDYYYIVISKPALLSPCYNFLCPKVAAFYKRRSGQIGVSLETFLRTSLTCCALMACWHEIAHVLRGHLDYLDEHNVLPIPEWTEDVASYESWLDPQQQPVLPERVLELDADIFGAQFLLTQVVHSSDVVPRMPRRAFAMAFAIGIRGLFEYLNEGCDHDMAHGSSHPHPLTRAYVAVIHSLVRLNKMGVTDFDEAVMHTIGAATLLEFEAHELGFQVIPEELERFQQTELKVWHKRSDELIPYQLVNSPRRKQAGQ